MSSPIDEFRSAWLSLDSLNGDTSLERMSLEMSAAEDPQLQAVLSELRAPPQAELDLRLNGDVESRHETRADALGRFVSRTANAVKEIAKSVGGLDRRAANLLVHAPAPGSVRIVFRAPVIEHAQPTIPGDTDGASLESVAIRRLAALFAFSEQVPDPDADPESESPLRASVTGLRGPARLAIARVAKTIAEAGWDIDGYLRQQGHPSSALRISTGGAIRLREAATEAVVERTTETHTGIIDGHRRSLGAMWFIPRAGRPFEAAVTTTALFERVGQLETPAGQIVRATFDVVSTFGSGDTGESDSVKKSRELTAIDAAPVTATADLF